MKTIDIHLHWLASVVVLAVIAVGYTAFNWGLPIALRMGLFQPPAPTYATDLVYIGEETTNDQDQAAIDAKVKAIHASGRDAVIFVCPMNELIPRAPIYDEAAFCFPLYFPR